ncbi:DgyrCDS14688 [Dimorphilus gyrociliatus]|uniref:DgyrCDS14688 n=1 Tax=Dimorphilus gyrociliatus TaxID=2664684 RepID=A0A7I8WEJ3_9ANNE|nr:DgyrCDS14688 [Dimorphilus gyrociliatus]
MGNSFKVTIEPGVFQVIVEGIVSGGKLGDIAIDDVKIGKCSSLECKRNVIGEDFEGVTHSRTIKNITCLKWTELVTIILKQSEKELFEFPGTSLEQVANNFCRNPTKDPKGPWCFTTYSGLREYCNIPLESVCLGYDRKRPQIHDLTLTIT